MKLYRVRVQRTVREIAEVEVRAESPADAQQFVANHLDGRSPLIAADWCRERVLERPVAVAAEEA